MITTTRYICDLARSETDVEAAQRLRFEVFNLEMDEGLDHSYLSNLDRDRFDQVCEHLIVRDTQTGEVVGTYRFQTGETAQEHYGYYSEQEFDLSSFESHRALTLELGRACIHRDHRNLSVLNLLWREIAHYAKANGLRYLIGCSSLTSQDPDYGLAAFDYLRLKNHVIEASLQTPPKRDYLCRPNHEAAALDDRLVKIPRLLNAYLLLGAKIGGPPAIDREFKTIDFLTILDLNTLPIKVWKRFLA